MKDLLGALCSGLCILHCTALPAVIAAGIPLGALALFTGEQAHLALSVLMVLFALWAFPWGWRRHKRALPSVVAGFGVGLLVIALMFEAWEVYLATLAGLSMIAAHGLNRYLLVKG